MWPRYLRLNAIAPTGACISLLVNVTMIVAVAERPNGSDARPLTEIVLHGGCVFAVKESVADISRWLNTPDSMSGPVLNPSEEPC